MRLASVVLLACVVGCGASLADARADAKATSEKLSACRDEARAAFFIDGKSEREALEVYEQCKRRHGL